MIKLFEGEMLTADGDGESSWAIFCFFSVDNGLDNKMVFSANTNQCTMHRAVGYCLYNNQSGTTTE
jgi:hypothetical protein